MGAAFPRKDRAVPVQRGEFVAAGSAVAPVGLEKNRKKSLPGLITKRVSPDRNAFS